MSDMWQQSLGPGQSAKRMRRREFSERDESRETADVGGAMKIPELNWAAFGARVTQLRSVW